MRVDATLAKSDVLCESRESARDCEYAKNHIVERMITIVDATMSSTKENQCIYGVFFIISLVFLKIKRWK